MTASTVAVPSAAVVNACSCLARLPIGRPVVSKTQPRVALEPMSRAITLGADPGSPAMSSLRVLRSADGEPVVDAPTTEMVSVPGGGG